MSTSLENDIKFLLKQLPKVLHICKTPQIQIKDIFLEVKCFLPELTEKVDKLQTLGLNKNIEFSEDLTKLGLVLDSIQKSKADFPEYSWVAFKYLTCQILLFTLTGLSLGLHLISETDPKVIILSIKDEMTLRLATGRVLKWTFESALIGSGYLRRTNLLFPIGDKSDIEELNSDPDEIDSLQLLTFYKPFYMALVALHNFNSRHRMGIVGEMIRRDYYPLILVCFAIDRRRRHQLNSKQPSQLELEIEQQFEQINFTYANQMFVIRDLLLLLTKCRPNVALVNFFNMMLSKHFTQTDGLLLVLNSTLDSEQSSERETTIGHRLQAIVNVIAELQVKDRELYISTILKQVIQSLLPIQQLNPKVTALTNAPHSLDIYWKMGTLLVSSIQSAHPNKAKLILFDPMWRTFESGNSETIDNIDMTVLIVHRLLLTRTCIDQVAPMFAPLFFISYWLTSQVSAISTKKLVSNILLEMLKEVPESIHLLNDCIQSDEKATKWLQRWKFVIDDSGEVIEHRLGLKLNRNEKEINEEILKGISTFALTLLDRMSEDYRFEYFFALLGELTESKRPSKVTIEMIELLSRRLFGATISKQQEEKQENVLLGCRRTIRFFAITFQRIVNRLIEFEGLSIEDEGEIQKTNEDISIFLDTLTMCLQILKILLEKVKEEGMSISGAKNKSTEDQDEIVTRKVILLELKSCHTSLAILKQSKKVLEWIQMTNNALAGEVNVVPDLDDLFLQMEQLYNEQKISELLNVSEAEDVEELVRFKKLIGDLKHNLMPLRAHALIEMRHRIYARQPIIEQQFEVVKESLQNCLADSESYVYLAAISTFGALANVHTKEVLPVLFKEFGEKNRLLAVRLKIGEVILRVIHSIGVLAYHYSPEFINELVRGVQSNEPVIQISSLSLLGEFCSNFRFGLSKYMVELMAITERLLMSPSTLLDVKRSVAVFLRLVLRGVNTKEMAIEISDHLKPIKEAIIWGQQCTVDPVLQRQCQLAYAEMDRIVRQVLLEGIIEGN